MELTIIELPAFYKTNCHQYKIFSDDYAIKVCDLENHIGIEIVHSSQPFNIGATESTEQEFKEMFNLINAKLCTL